MSEEVNKEQTKGAEQVERDELSEDQLQEAAGGSIINFTAIIDQSQETGDSTQRNAGAASPPNTAPGADTSDERIDEAADFPSRN